MKIAIIGAGNVGRALAKSWTRAGHSIIFGVQDASDPGKNAELSAIAPGCRVAPVAEAASSGEAIVLSVPWDAAPSAIAACGDLSGRIVIDVTNPLKFADGKLALAIGFDRSGGEEIARLASGAHVFKTLNQVGFRVMEDTADYASAPTMFVAGADTPQKAIVLNLVADLGFAAVDAGPLSVSRLLEPYAMLWIHLATSGRAPANAAFALQLKQETEA